MEKSQSLEGHEDGEKKILNIKREDLQAHEHGYR